MKKIILSVIALVSVAFSSNAQISIYLKQGVSGDDNQKSNVANITQEVSHAGYWIDGFSPFSVATITQIVKAGATGNSNQTNQYGSVNYTQQSQAGFNNYIILTQNNGVPGLNGGDGNKALLTQAGNNNVQQVYQQTTSSLSGNGGNFLITTQNAVASVIDIQQIGDGVGHSASINQGGAALAAYAQIKQLGSNNSLSVDQIDGARNSIVSNQDNPDATKAGNGLTLTQQGGDDNFIGISQWGSNNQTSISQNGNGNVVGASGRYTNAEQLGEDNTAVLNQIGDLNVIDFGQIGVGNSLTATQNGSGLTIYSTQQGNGNTATISQSGSAIGLPL